MSFTTIETVDTLKSYLYNALRLEHATIPPYLTALYSIRPGTNPDAQHILRVVVVEEMLHLTLAANLLNAIGGTPDLTKSDFVPTYPSALPDGEKDFEVPLQRFSPAAVDTFLKIERPKKAPEGTNRRRKRNLASCLAACPDSEGLSFYSIGEFYEEISRGFSSLNEKLGAKALFSGDPARQVGPEYYYSGGGEVRRVTDIKSAQHAIDLIIGQGEGLGGGIYDKEKEIAHYYRFDQLIKGRYYQPKDEPHVPTGPQFKVNWDAVFPIVSNARVAQYAATPDLHAAASSFNRQYARFLAALTKAYNGAPQLLLEAVPQMFRLRDGMLQLMHNPLPGSAHENAAPTFEIAASWSEP